MRLTLCRVCGVALAGTVTLSAACSSAPAGPREDVGSSAQGITRSTIVSRADEWVTAKLLYCQSPNGVTDPDTSCSAVCTRESNPAWDPYRSDCSGFVSWAWGLPAPGNTTDEFAPADTSVSYVINGSDLQPGDALNVPADHIILFVSWQTVGSVANFYEEPGCSATPPYAHAFQSDVTISGSSVTVAYEGKTFTAIRYTGVTEGDAGAGVDAGIPCTVTSTGKSGECIDTSECASKGGVSTPGYCPGATDIQCCTGMTTTTRHDAAAPAHKDSGASSPKGKAEAGSGAEGVDSGESSAGRDAATSGHRADAAADQVNRGAAGSTGGGCATAPVGTTGARGIGLAALAWVAGRRRRRGRTR